MKRKFRSGHSGVAAIWVMIVIAIVSAMMVATLTNFTTTRKRVDDRQNARQTEWLARAGCEIAAAKILSDPEGYSGETVTPIPNGEVKIAVRRDKDNKDVYHVTCEARYPLGNKGIGSHVIEKSFKRIPSPDGIRLESISK